MKCPGPGKSSFVFQTNVSEGGECVEPVLRQAEIFCRRAWGNICNDFWDKSDTAAVCNQQVCGQAASPSGDVTFAHSPRKIVMDDVQCRRNEKHQWECSHRDGVERNVAVTVVPVPFIVSKAIPLLAQEEPQ